MLNRERFAKEILDIICDGKTMAVVDGKPRLCEETPCGNCAFCGNCRTKLKEWANSEYVEPPVDWSKVPVDTPILVRDHKLTTWKKEHFSEYKNGRVYTWRFGTTSWSANGDKTCWEYAKLAESEG